MMRGPCGGRAIDLEASAASAIVVSQGLAAARLPITAGSRPLTHARPHPSPGRRSTRRASRSTGSDRGALGDPLVRRLLADQLGSATARSRGGGPSTTSDPGRPRPSGSPPTRSWRPESATWSGCPWSRRRMRSCGVWTRSRRSRRWSAPSLPAPHPGRCPPATSARSSDSPGPVEGVADDRLGGGAAGLSTPREVTPVKRSWTAVRPPVPRRRPGGWLP
jgi:hypothetical protein